MRWSLFVVPVDALSRDGMADWIASAVLRAACALAALAGAQLVFDGSAGAAVVVQPGEDATDLAGDWPWCRPARPTP